MRSVHLLDRDERFDPEAYSPSLLQVALRRLLSAHCTRPGILAWPGRGGGRLGQGRTPEGFPVADFPERSGSPGRGERALDLADRGAEVVERSAEVGRDGRNETQLVAAGGVGEGEGGGVEEQAR